MNETQLANLNSLEAALGIWEVVENPSALQAKLPLNQSKKLQALEKEMYVLLVVNESNYAKEKKVKLDETWQKFHVCMEVIHGKKRDL